MKKILSIVFALPILFSLNFALAEVSFGSAVFQASVPADFKDIIVVHITSLDLYGYSESIDKAIELGPTNMYLGSEPSLPAGHYMAETYMYKADDLDKVPYNNSKYSIDAVTGFTIAGANQVYEYKVNVVPPVDIMTRTPEPTYPMDENGNIISESTETPPPAGETVATPTPKPPSIFVNMVKDVFHKSWLTILLAVIVGGIYLFIKWQKTVYKE
jgi:hypothetical protein